MRRSAWTDAARSHGCASYRESEMMVFWWEGEAQVSKDTYGCDGSPTLCFLLAQLSWLITSPCRLVFSPRRKNQPGDRDDRSSLLIFAWIRSSRSLESTEKTETHVSLRSTRSRSASIPAGGSLTLNATTLSKCRTRQLRHGAHVTHGDLPRTRHGRHRQPDGRLVSHEHGAISSIVQQHHIAANANTKGFGINESGDDKSYETVWHYRAALAVIALDHANYEDDENSFIVASEEERYNATTQYMRTSTSLSTC